MNRPMMNWPILYARSRGLPAAAGALLGTAALLGAAVAAGDGATDPRLIALAVAAGVTAAAPGLGGQDAGLDRTAAIRWWPRRAAHVVLIAAAVAGTLLAAQTAGQQPTAAFLLRGSAGLAGLAALGAVLFGATYAWLPPVGWLALTLFVPHPPGGVTGWLLAPAGSGAAAWTGAVLLATGTAAYAVFGPRATARATC